MSEMTRPARSFGFQAKPYDPADPDPWLAMELDRALPFAPVAKSALMSDQSSASRQWLLPFVRPVARLTIILVQIFRVISPNWPNAPRLLHRMMAWGMKRFLTPEANLLILRHFNLGAEILGFIADNATPGFRPTLEPMKPRKIDDVLDNMFLKHDLNVYNFLIQLNMELDRRGTVLAKCDHLDFSSISDELDIEPIRRGRLNFIDLQTAIELYTPLYGALLTDRDFWRASNSLQLDETVGLYAARLTGEEKHLALISNHHPMVPFSTLAAGFRLMLHGLSTEVLHGFLRELKRRHAAAAAQPVAAE